MQWQETDHRSPFGRNCIYLNRKHHTDIITPSAEEWRMPMIRELLDHRDNKCTFGDEDFNTDQTTMLLNFLCTS